MISKNVFIGWSGENKEIAIRIGNLLEQIGFAPIVGGGKDTTLFVGNQIIEQMNKSDFAVLLLEKTSKSENATVSANVMFEWGYLLNKFPESNRIRTFVINMNGSELPSDIAGCWSQRVEKPEWKTEEEKEQIFDSIAAEIFNSFVSYFKSANIHTNKLDFLDDWDENKSNIFNYDGVSYIADKLLYGMQASIYTGTMEQLYQALIRILNSNACHGRDLEYVIKCALAIINVFITTKRLTCPLTEEKYISVTDELDISYELKIQDPDLAAWCKIFRIDKQELALEMYAESLTGDEKAAVLFDAIDKALECIELIDAQVLRNPSDSQYALAYYAFANRNIFQIYKKLYEIEPKEEYLEKQKEYCTITLKNREELYNLYRMERNKTNVATDYVTQEYILALTEQYPFETNPAVLKKIEKKVSNVYRQWKETNNIRNMIFDQITKEAAKFLK